MHPAIIIGAGRSGTNMLRDLLVSLPEFSTWPCDEINYIWRHGNRNAATDQFQRNMATPKITRFIRRQFEKMAATGPDTVLIEKTCANSLRCGFVHEIFPNAKFIHIIRDGRDVAASAALRWNAKLDVKYLLQKARFVPKLDLPVYAFLYLKARLFRIFSGKSRLSTWGPKFEGMQESLASNELPVACAIQWKTCVNAAMEQLQSVESEQVLTIQYEAFTKSPVNELDRICRFLGVEADAEVLRQLCERVSARSVGKWKSQLTEQQSNSITEKCGRLLKQLGYVD